MPTSVGLTTVNAQIIVKGTLASAGGSTKTPQMTFNYRRISTAVTPTKIALSNAFLAGPYAAMLAAFNARWSLGTSNIRWLNDATDQALTTILAGSGAIATDGAASFNSVFIYFRTALRGRKFKGGKHFPAVNEIDTTGDILTGAGLARWQAVQAAVFAPLTDATGNVWNPCIVSLSLSSLRTNPVSVVWNDVTQAILDLTLGTMRRRKSKTVI